MELPPSKQRRFPRRRLKYAIVTILLGTFSGYNEVLAVFRDALQSYFGIGVREFGLLLSIGTVPGALAALTAGILIDRWGPRAVLRGCLAGIAAGMLLAAQGKWWIVMLAAVAIISCFSYPLYMSIQSYLVNLFPRHRRRVLSLNLVIVSARGILFPLWAEYLLYMQRTHARLKFSYVLHLPFALLSLPLLLGIFLYRKEKTLGRAEPRKTDRDRRFLTPLPGSSMLLISLLIIHGMVDNTAYMWMPRVLDSESFPEQIFAPGFVMAAYGLAYVLSRGILTLIPERSGNRIMLIAPGILGGGIFLAGILSRSQPITAASYVLGGLLWSFEYPAILAVIAENERSRFGSALAMQALGSGLGTFLMANLMGWMGARFGDPRLWIILLVPASGFPLVGIGGAIWLLRYGSRETAERK